MIAWVQSAVTMALVLVAAPAAFGQESRAMKSRLDAIAKAEDSATTSIQGN